VDRNSVMPINANTFNGNFVSCNAGFAAERGGAVNTENGKWEGRGVKRGVKDG